MPETIEKIAEEIIKVRIRKDYVSRVYRFPTQYEIGMIMKRVKHKIKMNHGSIYKMRKDLMERKITKLVDLVMEDIKIT